MAKVLYSEDLMVKAPERSGAFFSVPDSILAVGGELIGTFFGGYLVLFVLVGWIGRLTGVVVAFGILRKIRGFFASLRMTSWEER